MTTNLEDEEKLREINSDKKNNRYFTFPSLEHAKFFRQNFHMVEKVIFLSAISTTEFNVNITEFFKNDLEFNGHLEFVNSKEIDEPSYLIGKISPDYQLSLFIELLKDIDLVEKLFIFENGKKKLYKNTYCKSDDYKSRNIVLRKGSLPAKHIDLFTLKPKKGPPLLEYIDNWKL